MKLIIFLVAPALALGAKSQPTKVDVSTLVRKEVTKQIGEDIEVRIENLHVPAEQTIPADAILTRLSPNPPLGVVRFDLESPKISKPIAGSAVVRVYARVALAKRPLQTGDALDSSVVEFQKREVSELAQSGFYTSEKALQGLEVRGFIRVGAAISSNNTRQPYAVVQGQSVDVVYRKHGLEVSAKGRSLQNGRVGEWIQVENINSRKTLRARVARNGEVETR